MNRDQLVGIIAVHLFSRFDRQSEKTAFIDLDTASKQRWLAEANDVLTMTGTPDSKQDILTKAMVQDVKLASELNWQFTNPETLVVLLTTTIVDMHPFDSSWKTERMLRACGVTRKDFNKNHKSIIGQEVNVRLELATDAQSGNSKLRAVNYEIYNGTMYNGRILGEA